MIMSHLPIGRDSKATCITIVLNTAYLKFKQILENTVLL